MNNIISTYKTVAMFAGAALTMSIATSCSNGDWEFDDALAQKTVYFAQQTPVRTITLGNDDDANNTLDNQHQFKLQATWGGGYSNNKDCRISYKIDPTLLEAGSGMEVLPESYYKLGDASTLTIPSGSIIGGTTVTLTDAFFADPKSATTHYVLPVKLVSSLTGDSILADKDYQLLCVKYKNQYTGLWCKTGTAKGGLNDVTYKNEDALDVINTTSLTTCTYQQTYIVEESQNGKKVNVSRTIDLVLTFAADGKVTVSQDGNVIGSGTFTSRGIVDFSDSSRMADCLKLAFKVAIVTNAGDAALEKTWTIDCNQTMTLMSRNNKLESWK